MKTLNESEATARIQPERYGLGSRFKFRCHPGVPCFTQCCRGINIILTPYDIIRLKNRLDMSSDEFLAIYTEPQLLEKTDLPVVTLKLLDDEAQSCPFVRDDGCIVYTDRPTTCRYYPLGTISLSHKESQPDDAEGFYFFVNEPHCRGFEEDKEWTVREWRMDQGVDLHDEINAVWTELMVRKRSFPKNIQLTEKAKQMFFLASYNIDKFKEFVFESSFLKLYKVEADLVEKLREDEIELLKFAGSWLKWLLFKEGDFEMDDAAVAERATPKA